MTNEEKAKEIANEMVEVAHYSSVMTPDEQRNNIMNVADVACMEMAKWKDEQHKKEIADLQRKLNAEKELRKQVEDSVRGLPQPIKDLINAMNMII